MEWETGLEPAESSHAFCQMMIRWCRPGRGGRIPVHLSFAVRPARSLISGIETIGKICGETRIFAALSPKFATPSFRSATKLYLEEGYPIAELHLQSSFNSPNCHVASAKYAS
jgi:hypothetical protein